MTSSSGLLLTLLVMIFASSIDMSRHFCCYCDALKFGFGGNNNNNKKEDEDTKAAHNSQQTPPTPTTPPTTILETEARTARELSKSLLTLQKQLSTCNDRISSITSAFQNLYSLHLKHIDGLRKCKEGMISSSDLQELLDATPSVVDNDGAGTTGGAATKKGQKEISKTFQTLLQQAHTTELQNQRSIHNEEIATKHKQLIQKLESQIHQLKLRETAWERTISELVARKDILERRETAWTRTISELMVDIEIRNKREGWWSVMRDEMRSRIGGLSYMAVLER